MAPDTVYTMIEVITGAVVTTVTGIGLTAIAAWARRIDHRLAAIEADQARQRKRSKALGRQLASQAGRARR